MKRSKTILLSTIILSSLVLSACTTQRSVYEPVQTNTLAYKLHKMGTCLKCAHKVHVDGSAVYMAKNQFYPKTITIKTGERVVWVNTDRFAHTITATNGAFDSGILEVDGRFSQMFSKPGTYHYYCKLHPEMKGVVVVR